MDKYPTNNSLYSLLANNQLLLFCPPWASMRRSARQQNSLTGLVYRIGFKRLDTGDTDSPSLNSRWADLSIYHNELLPMQEVCIIYMPLKPAVVTYVDVLHKRTLQLHSFLHIPHMPVTASNSYTPFPVVETERLIIGQTRITGGSFDLAKAVDSDVTLRVAQEVIRPLADATPDTEFPLQETLDGYCWKNLAHWLAVEPRLKQFHKDDHVFMLADVVLEIRNLVLNSFCTSTETTDTICEVFLCTGELLSSPRNIRTLPPLSKADMQAVVRDANESLTLKAFMSTKLTGEREHGQNKFHPLELLMSDPWLLFALRNFLSQSSPLFALLQSSSRLHPTTNPVVFTIRETFMGEPGAQYQRLWTDTAVNITTVGDGQEGIPVVTIRSHLVQQMDCDGTLGRCMKERGGMSSRHGQNQHATTIFLTGDGTYTYDDTLPFLVKTFPWNRGQLRSILASPLQRLESLMAQSQTFTDESDREEIL